MTCPNFPHTSHTHLQVGWVVVSRELLEALEQSDDQAQLLGHRCSGGGRDGV